MKMKLKKTEMLTKCSAGVRNKIKLARNLCNQIKANGETRRSVTALSAVHSLH